MWRTVASNIMWSLGFATAVLLLFDWILSEKKKKSLDDGAYKLWLWLADHKSGHVLSWLKDMRLQMSLYVIHVFAVLSVLALLARWLWVHDRNLFRILSDGATGLLAIMIGGYYTHELIAKRLARAASLQRYFAYCFLAWAAWTAPCATVIALAIYFDMYGLAGAVAGGFSFESLTLLDIMLLSALTVPAFTFLQKILQVGEFLLRRALEQKKGILLAFSGLTTALGVLIRYLQ